MGGVNYIKVEEYLKNGAVILDVRTHMEYNEENIPGSTHIVLDSIPENIEAIKDLNVPVVAICKSGIRSQHATDFLMQHGIDIINGGGLKSLLLMVKK